MTAEAKISKLTALVTKLDNRLASMKGKGGGGGSDGKGGSNDGKEWHKKATCNHCRQKGHKCPTKDDGKPDVRAKTPKGPSTGTGKWAPPKDGEPTTKEIDGTKWMWCSKCNKGAGRWTLNHETSGHQADWKPKDTDGAGSANIASISAELAALKDALCLQV